MFKQALLKALVPMTLITFTAIMAICPLYLTMSFLTRQLTEKTKTP